MGSGSEPEDEGNGEEEKGAESLTNHLEVPSQKEVSGRGCMVGVWFGGVCWTHIVCYVTFTCT